MSVFKGRVFHLINVSKVGIVFPVLFLENIGGDWTKLGPAWREDKVWLNQELDVHEVLGIRRSRDGAMRRLLRITTNQLQLQNIHVRF